MLVPVLAPVLPPAPAVELALLLLSAALTLLLAELSLLVALVPPAPPVPCGQMAASGSVSQRDCHFVSWKRSLEHAAVTTPSARQSSAARGAARRARSTEERIRRFISPEGYTRQRRSFSAI
jgi:hypothetical protein